MRVRWAAVFLTIGSTIFLAMVGRGLPFGDKNDDVLPRAATESATATTAIMGGTLIDGRGGPPMPDAVIVLRGDRIVSVGPRGRIAIPRGATVIDARGRWVLPGMIDNHVHAGGVTALAEWTRAGVTTLVDNGSRIAPDELKRRAALQPGAPRLFTSGPILTARGGYPALGAKSSSARFVADPRADVADVLGRQHADFVKIAIERGFLSDYDDEGWPALDPVAVAAIVAEGHRRGALVRAHVTQVKELTMAIDS
jgi:imidazolonepropionase-like amidohydrolase